MYNSNSAMLPYVEIWDESRKDKWMREKEPNSIQVPFSPDIRFHTTMNAFADWRQEVTERKTCLISGMRAEESFNRFRATTSGLTYKDVTWGRRNKKTYCFHPFYDWSFRDVWKYIHDNNIAYNKVYDDMYQLGVPVNNMRVSNLIHEYTTALLYLQEIEPKTYERLCYALPGISTRTKFAEEFIPKKLPEMFTSWKEYRDYLLTIGTRYISGRRFLMGQCFYLPKGMSKGIRVYKETWKRIEEHPTGLDTMIADYLGDNKRNYLNIVPNLVDHLPVKSLINPRRSTKRQSLTFKR